VIVVVAFVAFLAVVVLVVGAVAVLERGRSPAALELEGRLERARPPIAPVPCAPAESDAPPLVFGFERDRVGRLRDAATHRHVPELELERAGPFPRSEVRRHRRAARALRIIGEMSTEAAGRLELYGKRRPP
jgi:hypothetical protein